MTKTPKILDPSTEKLNVHNETFEKRSFKTKWFVFILLGIMLIAIITLAALLVRADRKIDELNKSMGKCKIIGEKSQTTRSPNAIITSTKQKLLATATPENYATGNGPYLHYRLSKNVIPSHYNIFLKVDLYNKTVRGTTTINVNVTKPTSYVYLHAYDYKNIEGFLRNSKGKDLEIRRKYLYNENQYYVIETNSDIDVGEYILYFEFDYMLKKNLKGFYESTYKTSDGKIRPVAITQMAPVDARRAFPCFDEPAMKSTFTITIAHHKEFIAISNMDIAKQEEKNGMIYDTFEKTPIMSTYLVAFVVCDFDNRKIVSNTENATSMTYYTPAHQISQLNYSMEVGSKVLGYFEKYFELKYPLKKADMIGIPALSFGAMENWGLVIYRLSVLLYSPDESSVADKHAVNTYVSHELAHQWFGNLVTMDWWSDLWLKEGFASYIQYLGMNATEPDWNSLDLFVIDDMEKAFKLDSSKQSHPIFVEVKHPSEISEIFDFISYLKGASVLRMLENVLGREVFRKGLVRYLKKYSYRNAKTKDLFEDFSFASAEVGDNINVTEIMNTWVLQMGFPVINVAKESGGTFSLKQQRFLRDPNPDISKEKYQSPYSCKWHAPFNYEVYDISNISNVKVVQTNRVWLRLNDGMISGLQDSDDIIIKGNTGQYGFFRVNYEVKLWKKLQEVLKNNHEVFDVKDRVGLISDAFAMANSDRLDFGEAMNIVDYIHLEKDYLPWKAAYDAINSIMSRMSTSSVARNFFQKYILSKVENIFNVYKLTPQVGHQDRYLQILISSMACGSGHKECLRLASELFQKWKTNSLINKVPGDLRSLVYYYGVYNGGQEEWDFVFQQYLNNEIASEKLKLLYALAATKQDWLIDRYLNLALNESVIKYQDVSTVFNYVANSNPKGRYQAWNFIKLNWDALKKQYFDAFYGLKEIFKTVIKGFNTDYELIEMKKFVASKIIDQYEFETFISSSEESIKENINWLKLFEKPITDWLKNNIKRSDFTVE